MPDAAASPTLPDRTPHTPREYARSYVRFLWQAFSEAFDGGPAFYIWMILLTAVALVGANAWAIQVRDGMGLTHMSDHVSWGLYIANFTFLVGLAAGGVMMVIPAYLYHDEEMHDVVIVGELLAIAAILMALFFVVVDLGRPDRFWHLIPFLGKFHFPVSMLTWDVIVLNGYLVINAYICTYLLYERFIGRKPNPRWYVPFVFLSIAWAISIHTVTAFLYCGLGGRPFWNTALLAPRFLASAFVSGPAFIILAIQVIRRVYHREFGNGPIETLTKIMRVTILVNFLMVLSELFVEFYTGGSHTSAAHYLYLGLHGRTALVPWIWSAIAMNLVAAVLLLTSSITDHPWRLNAACVLAFAGIWIEKGMGLIIPGFIPSTLHEVVEYLPSLAEWKITAGIWAFGLLLYTVFLKITASVFARRRALDAAAAQAQA